MVNSVNNLTTSEEGLNLIRSEEGTIYHLYDDVSGNCTFGTGHLVHMGPTCGAPSEIPFRNGTIDELKAKEAAALRQDVSFAEHVVNVHVSVPLKQNEFDGLVDFTFNEGAKTFLTSTLLKILNAGNRAGVPAELAKYKYSRGRVLDDLIRRRKREADLFMRAS